MKAIYDLCKKNKIMSDLILNKQRKKEAKITTRVPSISKAQLRLIKTILFAFVYLVFLILSIQNNQLFLKEILVSGGIIAVLYFVHVLSQKQ